MLVLQLGQLDLLSDDDSGGGGGGGGGGADGLALRVVLSGALAALLPPTDPGTSRDSSLSSPHRLSASSPM